MIEHDPDEGGFYIACDFCSNDVNIQQSDFMRAIEALKMRRWKIIKNPQAKTRGEEWLHKCPQCQESEMR